MGPYLRSNFGDLPIILLMYFLESLIASLISSPLARKTVNAVEKQQPDPCVL